MPQWLVVHRDKSGTIHRVDGLWDAETGPAAIAQMLAKHGGTDDGSWEAEQPDERHDMMKWHLDNESKGKPRPSD